MRNTSQSLIDLILFGVVALIWSSSFLLIKIAVAEIPPGTIAATRVLVAAALLYAYLRLRGERLRAGAADLGKFAFIGLFGNVVPFVLIGVGELTIDSGMAAILMGVMPLATALMAHLAVPDEPFTPRVALGIACGFGGVVALVGIDALKGVGATTYAQLAVLGAALCYAVTTVFVRRTTTLAGPVMAAGSQIAATLLILPLALWWDRPWLLRPSLAPVAAVFALGLFATAVATVLYFRLVRNLGAATLAQVNYLIPVLGTGWGILFLAERPRLSALVALVMVVVGVAVVSRRPRRAARR